MSWTTILKALPNPDAVSGMLYRKEGLDLLINQAKGDNKKNIIRVRNKAKELSQGKGMPEGLDSKTIQANAITLLAVLDKEIKESNSNTQSSLETKLETIIENEDKQGLIKLVGTSSPRKIPNKTRNRKSELLQKNKKRILKFIELDDIDLFYFITDKLTFTAIKPTNDDNWDDKVEALKTELEDTSTTIEETDSLTINFEKKTNWSDMKTILDITNISSKRKRNIDSSYIVFKKNGRLIPSPLLQLFEDVKTTQSDDSTVQEAESKTYKNMVSTPEHAIKYLETVMSHRKIKQEIEFMPTPNINSGALRTIKNAKLQLLGNESSPRISSSLKALFNSSTFDLQQLMQQGEKANEMKYSPPRIRAILESNKDMPELSITSTELNELRTLYNDSRNELPVFIKRVARIPANSSFRKLNRDLINERPNLFTEEEKDMLLSLADKTPKQVNVIINNMYGKTIDKKSARLLDTLMVAGNPFQQIEGGYKFKPQQNIITINEMKSIVSELRQIRQHAADKTTAVFTTSLEDSLKLYKKGFKVNTTGVSSPTDMLHFLYVLDLYYGRTGFKSTAKQFKNDKIEQSELLSSAHSNYQSIIQGFVDKVKDKVDEILENKASFQSKLSSIEGDKTITYELFKILESNGIIHSEG
jgi:hypothetical protein